MHTLTIANRYLHIPEVILDTAPNVSCNYFYFNMV